MKIIRDKPSLPSADDVVVLASPRCSYIPGATPGSVVHTDDGCTFIAVQGAGTQRYSNGFLEWPADDTDRWVSIYNGACQTSRVQLIPAADWVNVTVPWQGSPFLTTQRGAASNASGLECVRAATTTTRASDAASQAHAVQATRIMAAVFLSAVGCVAGTFLIHKAVVTKPWQHLDLPWRRQSYMPVDDIELGEPTAGAQSDPPHQCLIDDAGPSVMIATPVLGLLAGFSIAGLLFMDKPGGNPVLWGVLAGTLGAPTLAALLVRAKLV